jgi:hypothetical protein
MSIISEHQRPERPRGRPLTATQCALAIVTAGLAVAAAMLALIASAGTAQAGQSVASGVASDSRGSVFAEVEAQSAPTREGSVFTEFQPQVGPYRTASVFSAFQLQPSPTFTPFPQPSPSPVPGPWLPSMSMPVEGTWQLTYGYRCGLDTEANNATFPLDIVAANGDTAGQPVYSPVDGQIISYQAALLWDREQAIIAVAVAEAESGWRPDAQGDHIDCLVAYYAGQLGVDPDAPLPYLSPGGAALLQGVGLDPAGAAPASRSLRQEFWRVWGPMACNGYTSFGAWQINTMFHQGNLRDHTHSSDPCVWRDYLFDVGANAQVAHDIWLDAGWSRWSAYTGGWYAAYIGQATSLAQ